MEKRVLRDYLEQIRLLETDIYTMEETIQLLQKSRKSTPVYCPPRKPTPKNDPVMSKPSTAGTVVGALALGAFGTLPAIPYLLYRHHKSKKAQAEYDTKLANNQQIYADELAQYERQLPEYEKSYALALEKTCLFNTNLDKQIDALTASKASTETVLKKLYDLGIIYQKYRSLVPISMFCEYLDSGLRTELHGANGMYDLYERQLMGQQIVGELSMVNSNLRSISYQLASLSTQLNGIQRNQILLYEEVARGNAIAREIQKGTENLLSTCENSLSSIQNAAEMTAFNTEAAARRTDAIARIAEYEFATNHSPYIIP